MEQGDVETESRVLKHVQVREYVRSLVVDGIPGSPAPSERELVNLFGVARMTVRQAMDGLVTEGLLERIPGRGTFVAQPRRTPTRVLSFTEEMRRRGLQPESATLLARREQAGPGVARALGIAHGDGVIHWKRLRRADGGPVCVEDAYLNEALLPDFLQGSMPASLYAELANRGMRPTRVEDNITADAASLEEAGQLEITPGAAVLRQQRRAFAEQRPVEVSRTAYRSDRFILRLQLGPGA